MILLSQGVATKSTMQITKKKYHLERKDGTEFLIANDGVLEAKEIQVK